MMSLKSSPRGSFSSRTLPIAVKSGGRRSSTSRGIGSPSDYTHGVGRVALSSLAPNIGRSLARCQPNARIARENHAGRRTARPPSEGGCDAGILLLQAVVERDDIPTAHHRLASAVYHESDDIDANARNMWSCRMGSVA